MRSVSILLHANPCPPNSQSRRPHPDTKNGANCVRVPSIATVARTPHVSCASMTRKTPTQSPYSCGAASGLSNTAGWDPRTRSWGNACAGRKPLEMLEPHAHAFRPFVPFGHRQGGRPTSGDQPSYGLPITPGSVSRTVGHVLSVGRAFCRVQASEIDLAPRRNSEPGSSRQSPQRMSPKCPPAKGCGGAPRRDIGSPQLPDHGRGNAMHIVRPDSAPAEHKVSLSSLNLWRK